MQILKGKGSLILKISAGGGGNNCPELKVSRSAIVLKDDYHSRIRTSKSMLSKFSF
jgi:hypothetical protein